MTALTMMPFTINPLSNFPTAFRVFRTSNQIPSFFFWFFFLLFLQVSFYFDLRSTNRTHGISNMAADVLRLNIFTLINCGYSYRMW